MSDLLDQINEMLKFSPEQAEELAKLPPHVQAYHRRRQAELVWMKLEQTAVQARLLYLVAHEEYARAVDDYTKSHAVPPEAT